MSIVPGVSILGVLGHLNYEPWFALAEYVDNSIQSASKSYAQIAKTEPGYRLRVDVAYEKEHGGRITILDNAGGIARRDFGRAFKAAEVPPDRTGLSEFGMGMKSASIWFARNWRVTTTSVGDPTEHSIEFDMDSVLAENVERLSVMESPVSAGTHYTRIELWNLNQFLPGRTLGKVREHLREIYRGFLRDDRLSLWVAGQEMRYEEPLLLRAPDVRAETSPAVSGEVREWRKEIEFIVDDVITVKGWAGIRAEGKTGSNGLSLFRRGRVIVGTGETPYRPVRIYGQGNSYRSQRLFGELEIVGLPVSHTKDGFQWHEHEESFEEALRAVLDSEPLPLLKQAENYRARQASKAEQRRIAEATQNTVEVASREVPAAFADLLRPDLIDAPPPFSNMEIELEEAPPEITGEFSFPHGDRMWTFVVTSASLPADTRWLMRHVEVEAGGSTVTARLTFNTANRFVKQFALGSTDATEAVLRVAFAMVISESLLTAAGDHEVAATFMRKVDMVLGGALSKRIKDGV